MSELRVGVIGCGALGRVHAERMAATPGVQVAALSDPDVASAQRAADPLRNRPASVFLDYRELLDCGLDAVCIASPDSFHVPQVLDALAANLHVLCEKPLTPNPDDLEAVIESAAEVGKHVAMTYPRRYDSGFRAMRDEIRSGQCGRVTTITAYNAEDWITPNRGTWRHDPAICPGGFFYDASGHQIDTLLWATGLEAISVRAESQDCGTPSPMLVWGAAELTGGVPMAFAFVGNAHRWREQLNVHCEAAEYAVENMRVTRFDTATKETVPLGTPEASETADQAFVKLIRGEGPNWAPPEELWPVLRFTHAGLQSAALRRAESA